MTTKQELYFVRGAAVLALIALAGCGAPVKKDDGGAVEARAAERWDLLIKHQAAKAYDYLTPGFRQTITREQYAAQKNDVAMRWKAARVSGHACDGDSCTVTVMVDTEVKMAGLGKMAAASMPTQEHWIKVGRGWFYLPDTRLKVLPANTGEPKPEGPAGIPPAQS